MKSERKYIFTLSCFGLMFMAFALHSCETEKPEEILKVSPIIDLDFPDFITPIEDYFDTRIASVPSIDGESYRLKISGAIENPTSFTLEELSKLPMVEKTLTIECIGNSANGSLIGTADWRGFKLYDLLEGLDIKEGASTVKYLSADGYYTYNTLEELRSSEVLGALTMNNESIPPLYGYPLRIIYPGYYGVRQPGWVVEMEVLESGPEDFWTKAGWKSDAPMGIDSKIFFPASATRFALGDSIKVGGAAYGSKQIYSVELTLDDGATWIPANITRHLDQDDVWVFWTAYIIAESSGAFSIRSRATATDGSVQPKSDSDYRDGTDAWPKVNITVL